MDNLEVVVRIEGYEHPGFILLVNCKLGGNRSNLLHMLTRKLLTYLGPWHKEKRACHHCCPRAPLLAEGWREPTVSYNQSTCLDKNGRCVSANGPPTALSSFFAYPTTIILWSCRHDKPFSLGFCSSSFISFNIIRMILMKNSIALAIALFAKSVMGLPDFSHLVPGTATPPPTDGTFKYGPFFELSSGVPPSSIPAPHPAPPTLPPTMPPTLPPTTPPTLPPTFPPHRHTQPPVAPVAAPTSAPVVPNWVTRTSFYHYQWGSVTQGCQYKAPDTILKCMQGGILLLTVNEQSNAACEKLALDVALCAQADPSTDAIVDFQCIGNTAAQLVANARTLPSEATNCTSFNDGAPGGNAVAAASLGRFCKNPTTGVVALNTSYPCSAGTSGIMNGNQFCSSFNQCNATGCQTSMQPVDTTAFDQNLGCSTPEIHLDLTNFQFHPSSLASYQDLKWTFSDSGFQCDWTVPDIEIACRNGGLPKLVDNVPFCHTPAGSDVIVCTNPNPGSAIGRVVIDLKFWCFGNSPEQLIFEVRTVPVDTSAFVCEPGGLIVQGLDLSRGCGKFNNNTVPLVQEVAFCANPAQFRQNICFDGFSCPANGPACTNITLDSVVADTADLAVSSCIYAEQIA